MVTFLCMSLIAFQNGVNAIEVMKLNNNSMSPKKRESICLIKEMHRPTNLAANASNSQEVKNYLPPGDLAKSGNVKNSKSTDESNK